nr:hypothetical protein 15 [Saccharospirillaceae bacterium]
MAGSWKWDTKISTVRSFNNSDYVCFKAEGIDRSYICFDSSQPGGKERVSMLLAAKMANAPVDVSYKEPQNGESILWLETDEFYWSHHFYLR